MQFQACFSSSSNCECCSHIPTSATPALFSYAHQLSHRKHNKYIAVNCGAIPEGTIDSELFGHEKGSFTGASQTRNGYFEVADGGTIFLDEIGDISPRTQLLLLRFLQEKTFTPVGQDEPIHVDVRVIAATNAELQEMVKQGKFREDLFYRINVIPIELPPLRRRRRQITPKST